MEQTKIQEKIELRKKYLPNKVIKLKPILKPGKMIKDPRHIGYFMYNDAFKIFMVPRSEKTGSYTQILTSEEVEFFSNELQVDLSFNKKVDNFWDTYSFRITKNDSLMSNGLEFDLSDPYSNIDYRLMQAQRVTAPSFKERFNSPKYRWYLAEENEEMVAEAEAAEKTEEIWTFFGGIKGSRKKLTDLLSVYYAQKAKSKELGTANTIEFLIAEVRKIIKNDPEFIIECKNDPNYDIKALIIDGVKAGAINKSGRNKYNIIGDSSNYDYLSLTNRLAKLKEDGDDDYLRITEQVAQYREEETKK